MPRLRNELTGAVMTVDDSTAERLGSEWKPEATKAKSEDKPSTRRTSK